MLQLLCSAPTNVTLEKAIASCSRIQTVEVLAGYLQKTIKSFDINIFNGIKEDRQMMILHL